MNSSNAEGSLEMRVRDNTDYAGVPVSVINEIDTVSVMRVAIQVHNLDGIVTARRQARALGARAGFSPSDLTIIATAISEIARNIVEYAGSGDITISLLDDGIRLGIEILASDRGPGIADLPRVMRDGYSSEGHLGIGLPGARRLVDEFEIASSPGSGTRVRMRKFSSR